MNLLITLIVCAACGIGCYKLAEAENRDKTLGAVMGVLFGIIALLVYACLDKKE